MPLKTAVVKTGATLAPTGGSDLTFADLGTIGSSVALAVPADTDLRLRRTVIGGFKSPKPNAGSPNGYTQARANLVFKKPKLLANGKLTVNTIQVSIAYDWETTDAEKTELLDVAAQMCFDTDFTPFFKQLNPA